MAASDNIGEQFIDVFHSSSSRVPPHIKPGRKYFEHVMNWHGKGDYLNHMLNVNQDGNIIFTGTRAAAETRANSSIEERPYMHKYSIPESMVRPETWGDDMLDEITGSDRKWGDNTPHELWESVPVQTDLADEDNALKFRNKGEDAGNLSYVIHKGAVLAGKIKYGGVEKR